MSAADVGTAGPGQSRTLRLAQAVLVLFGAVVGASAVVPGSVDALVALGLVASGGTAALLARTVLQFAVFTGVVAAYLVAAGDRDLVGASLPDRREWLLVAGGGAVLLVSQFALLDLMAAAGVGPGQNEVISPGHPPIYFLAMVPLSVLVVGPAEELLFRGVVQGLLRRAWSAAWAIAIASLLFGLVHYPAVSGTVVDRLAYVALAAVLGSLLGVLYERTGNLAVPAFAHGGYNAVLFGLQYLNTVG